MAGDEHKASNDSGSAKKHQAISMETMVATIKKLNCDEKMVKVAHAYSTVVQYLYNLLIYLLFYYYELSIFISLYSVYCTVLF